jgi:hypothetical protein
LSLCYQGKSFVFVIFLLFDHYVCRSARALWGGC